jgi:hypothetical protein
MDYRADEQTLRNWLDECLNHGRNLTEWEQDFCESLDQQLVAGRRLSPVQQDILERIYAEKTIC